MNAQPSAVISTHLQESGRVKLALLENVDLIEQAAAILSEVRRSGGTVFSCGNGGSCCDAIHLTEELVARYKRERAGIRAAHFCDPATITCWANDYEYSKVFERQARTFLTPKDALVVFSTSGNSPNVVRALGAANELGAHSVALLGKGGGAAKELASVAIVVASDVTAHIQEAHITLVHILCELIEVEMLNS